MIEINKHRPVRLHTTDILPPNCSCVAGDRTKYVNATKTINVEKLKYFRLKIFFFLYSGLL